MVPAGGVEPPFPACHAGVLPLNHAGVMVDRLGVEPSAARLRSEPAPRCSTR